MKKLLFLTMAAVVVAVSGANAQNFNKGDWLLNGSFSGLDLNYGFMKDYSETNVEIQAAVGHFVVDKVAIDATLGLGIWKAKDFDADTTFSFGLGVRYYPTDNLFARVGYNGMSVTDEEYGAALGISVGYDWFLSRNVFFEPAVYYQKTLGEGGGNALGLSLGVGVKF